MTLKVAPITDEDTDAAIALWGRCDLVRPWNDPAADILRARQHDNSEVLAGRDGALVATAMVGHDGHRGWIYYLAVAPDMQRRGYGRAMVAAAEAWLRGRGIEKVMLMVRPENDRVRAFYAAIGYGEQPRTVLARWLDGRPATP